MDYQETLDYTVIMLEMDAAEHPLASEEPERDPIAELIFDLQSARELSAPTIERIVREWSNGRDDIGQAGVSGALVDVLHMFVEPRRDPRILGYAFLFLLNKCPHSMEDIARKIGCTRAAISKEKRILEERFGIQSRASVIEEAREDRSEACRERGQKKPRNQQWAGAQHFRNLTAKP